MSRDVGVRKPDLRSFDSGNSSHGEYATGAPRKYTRRVVRGADLAQLVDLELVAPQVPVVVRRDARRVARVGRLVLVGAGKRISVASPRAPFSPMKKRGDVKKPVSVSRLNFTRGR